jgi:Guanine nucleotide exchange factor synembryn
LLDNFDPGSYAGNVITDLAGRRSISGQLRKVQDDKSVVLLRLLFLFTLKGVQSINGHIMACLNMASTKINAMERNGIPESQGSTIELLKLLFNLLHNYPTMAIPHFGERASSLIAILRKAAEDLTVCGTIHRYICNVLLCSPLEQWQKHAPLVASSIMTYLQFMLGKQDVSDVQILSELALLQTITICKDPEVNALLKSNLVPGLEDRKQVLGQSGSLISLMLKATTNIDLRHSRTTIYGILWKVSNESRKPPTNTKFYNLCLTSPRICTKLRLGICCRIPVSG